MGRLTMAVVLLGACAAFGQQVGNDDPDLDGFDGCPNPLPQGQQPTSLEVPTQVPSIQAAIALVADGGEIRILPGSYTESLVIAGKRVKLIGQGNVSPELVAASPTQAVVTFGTGGGGRIENLSLRGGAAGVLGEGANGLPAPVLLKRVAISAGQRGIYGSFSKLALARSEIAFTQGNGIGLTGVSQLVVRRVEVRDVAGSGIVSTGLLSAIPCSDQTFRWVTISRPGHLGLAVANSSCKVHIDRVNVDGAKEAGIDLFNVGATDIHRTLVSNTVKYGGQWGDGVRVWSTHVTADDLRATRSARSAVSIFGCGPGDTASLELTDSAFDCNVFFANLEQYNLETGVACGSGATLTESTSGETSCRDCSLNPTPCHAESTGVAPIATVPTP
jgi:hypothetical protein